MVKITIPVHLELDTLEKLNKKLKGKVRERSKFIREALIKRLEENK